MEQEILQRKLAAILSADVKGYSRLMGEDEAATIRTLTAYRANLFTLLVLKIYRMPVGFKIPQREEK